MYFIVEIYSDCIPYYLLERLRSEDFIKVIQRNFVEQGIDSPLSVKIMAGSNLISFFFSLSLSDCEKFLQVSRVFKKIIEGFSWKQPLLNFSSWPRPIHSARLYTELGTIDIINNSYINNNPQEISLQKYCMSMKEKGIILDLEEKAQIINEITKNKKIITKNYDEFSKNVLISDSPSIIEFDIPNYNIPVEIVSYILISEYLCLTTEDLKGIYLLTEKKENIENIQKSVIHSVKAKLLEASIYFNDDLNRKYILVDNSVVSCKQKILKEFFSMDFNVFSLEETLFNQSRIVQEYRDLIHVMRYYIFKDIINEIKNSETFKILADNIFNIISLFNEGKTFSSSKDPFCFKQLIDSSINIILDNDNIIIDFSKLVDIYKEYFPLSINNLEELLLRSFKTRLNNNHRININLQAIKKNLSFSELIKYIKDIMLHRSYILSSYKRLKGIVPNNITPQKVIEYDLYNSNQIKKYVENKGNLIEAIREMNVILDTYKVKDNNELLGILQSLKDTINLELNMNYF